MILNIDDFPTSTTLLESWMLFPQETPEAELLRWSHARNATLDDIEKGAKFADSYAKQYGMPPRAGEEPPTGFIDLVPTIPTNDAMVYIRAEDLAELLKRPTTLCEKLAKKSSADALVVGSLLLYLRLLDQQQISPQATFTCALNIAEARDLEMTQEIAKARDIATVRDIEKTRVARARSRTVHSGASIEPRTQHPRNLIRKELWPTYAPVSHLWAALHTIKGLCFEPVAHPLSGISIPVLLSIAASYKLWSNKFFARPRNQAYFRKNHFHFLAYRYIGKIKAKEYDFSKLQKDENAMRIVRKTYPNHL